jgi:hypothetical protein
MQTTLPGSLSDALAAIDFGADLAENTTEDWGLAPRPAHKNEIHDQ